MKISIITLIAIFLYGCSTSIYDSDGQSPKNLVTSGSENLGEIPYPDKLLFDRVPSSLKDSVGKKFTKGRLSTRSIKNELTFIPVLRLIESNKAISFAKDTVNTLFYGPDEKGLKTLYVGYLNPDRSNYTPDKNSMFYKGVVAAKGQEFADRMVKSYKDTKGADLWNINRMNGVWEEEINFALTHSDDKTFFIIFSGRIPRTCYYHNNVIKVAKKNSRSGEIEELEFLRKNLI